MSHAIELVDDSFELLSALLEIGVACLSAEPLTNFGSAAVGYQITFFRVLPIETGSAWCACFSDFDDIAGHETGVQGHHFAVDDCADGAVS